MPTDTIIGSTRYNNLQNRISVILGTAGAGTSGYGQPDLKSRQVVIGDEIKELAFNNLSDDMRRARHHQTGTDQTTNFPTVVKGETIITDALFANLETQMAKIEQDKMLIGPGQGLPESLPIAGVSSVRTTGWNGTLIHNVTIDFGSASAARYFFNAGGKIRFYATLRDGDGSLIYADWNNLLTNAGVISLDYTKTTTTGSGRTQEIGFYDLTTASQIIFSKSGGGVYSGGSGVYGGSRNYASYASNDYSVYARCDVADNSSGGARYIYLSIYFNDDKGVHPNFDENVTGTLTSYVDHFRPQGANVSVAGPNYINTTELSGTATPPSYIVTGTPASGNESTTFTFNVTTTSITSGTVLFWSVEPVSGLVNASDFSDWLTTGTVTINNNSGVITRRMRADGTTETTEQFRIKLYSDSARTRLLATSNTVTVANSS